MSSSAGKSVVRLRTRQPFVAPLVPARLVPQFETQPLPDQHGVARQAAEFAQVRRQQHTSVPVEFQIRGVADHQPLQAPCTWGFKVGN